MEKKDKNRNKGFTLVETLVAISILSVSILGTFTAVQSGLSKSNYAKEQIVAFYLIQEAMESIRNKRDTNALNNINSGVFSVNWLHGISELITDPCSVGKICTVDSFDYDKAPICTGICLPPKLTSCPGTFGTCPPLNQDISTGLFGYNPAWPQTKYTREIQVVPIDAKEVVVTVRVTWNTGSFSKSVQVKESLFDIR